MDFGVVSVVEREWPEIVLLYSATYIAAFTVTVQVYELALP